MNCLRFFALLLLSAVALVAQSSKFTIAGSAVSASTYDTANNAVPANAVDGSLSTRWAGQGDGAFITFDLGPSQAVHYVKIAWYQGNTRTTTFDVLTSNDGLAFTNVYSGISSGTTTALETYDFADTTARYVRIVGHGNSSGNGWNSITEVEVWGVPGSGGGGTVPFTVEAESVPYSSSHWQLVSDGAASGGQGFKALVNSTSSAPGAGGLVYSFTLSSASTVYLQIKAKAANTSSDSVWVRLDTGSWAQFTFDSTNQFTWRNKSYSSVAAGTHTFEIRCREANAVLDLVAVTLNNGTPPPVSGGGGPVAAPSFSPGGGTYSSTQNVTITSATSGASIRYTTNGADPTSTTGTVYSSPVAISATATLKAIAYKSGQTDSSVTSATYTITTSPPPQVAAPTFSPPAGTYSSAQSVTISTTTSGATIRYTTNGTNPTSTSGTVYSGAVSVAATGTLKAIAYKSGSTDSTVSTAAYTINTNGLDPNAPPGSNFDLSKWKITLPINDAEEHSAAELVAGYEHPDWFFTDASTGGMVFKAPNIGDTTGGSSYTRSELREMLNPTGSATAANNNWVMSTSSASAKSAAGGVDGTMTATLTVDHVSTTGDTGKVGRVIVGQIHAPDTEIIRLYYHKRPSDTRGAIYFGHDTPSNSNTYHAIIGDPNNLNPANGILLGQVWSYEIKVVGQTMTVKVTPQGGSTTTATFSIESGYNNLSQYFKAGVYNQNNTGTSTDYAQATFYSLTHTHP